MGCFEERTGPFRPPLVRSGGPFGGLAPVLCSHDGLLRGEDGSVPPSPRSQWPCVVASRPRSALVMARAGRRAWLSRWRRLHGASHRPGGAARAHSTRIQASVAVRIAERERAVRVRARRAVLCRHASRASGGHASFCASRARAVRRGRGPCIVGLGRLRSVPDDGAGGPPRLARSTHARAACVVSNCCRAHSPPTCPSAPQRHPPTASAID